MAQPPPSDSDRTEQVITRFLHKTLHAVLASRIPHLHRPQPDRSAAAFLKRDRWFHLAIGEVPVALHHLAFGGVMDPMIIDVILTPRDTGEPEVVVERWTAQCEPPAPPSDGSSASALHRRTYRKSIILLRSLYALLRLLPAYRIFRMLCSSNQAYNYDLSYRVSSFAEPFSREEEAELKHYNYMPVETLFGQLVVSVQYRPSLASFNFELSSLVPPTIIMDYVGSPAAEPIKALPSSLPDRSSRPTSYPFRRGIRTSSSVPFDRPHSWNTAQLAHFLLSPSPGKASELMFSPPDNCGQRGSSHRSSTHRKGSFSFDEFKLSPPFSDSPTPSPPTQVSNYLQSRLRAETVPVNIPIPVTGKSQTSSSSNLSDPPRSLFPPPSPRTPRPDLSSQESPLDSSRSFRRTEGSKMGDIYSILHTHSPQKGLMDGRDDFGRFSAVFPSGGSPSFGFSRSSSRLSNQDDLDDGDFSYPFAVDDVDTSDSQTRNHDGNEAPEHASSHKSQDAAVGVLVNMLKTAQPLREDQSFSSQSTRSELKEDAAISSFYLSRKTSDALDELQMYKEMKDLLLSHSGTKLIGSVKQRKEWHSGDPIIQRKGQT